MELVPHKTEKPDLTDAFNFVKGTSRPNFTLAILTILISINTPFKSLAKRFFEIPTPVKLFYLSTDWSLSISTGVPRIYTFPTSVLPVIEDNGSAHEEKEVDDILQTAEPSFFSEGYSTGFIRMDQPIHLRKGKERASFEYLQEAHLSPVPSTK